MSAVSKLKDAAQQERKVMDNLDSLFKTEPLYTVWVHLSPGYMGFLAIWDVTVELLKNAPA